MGRFGHGATNLGGFHGSFDPYRSCRIVPACTPGITYRSFGGSSHRVEFSTSRIALPLSTPAICPCRPASTCYVGSARLMGHWPVCPDFPRCRRSQMLSRTKGAPGVAWLRRRSLPRNGTDHDSKPLPSLPARWSFQQGFGGVPFPLMFPPEARPRDPLWWHGVQATSKRPAPRSPRVP